MVNVIIPTNGLGSRFQNEGYSMPKPLINVLGKRMIFWVIDSLNLSDDDILTIPYNTALNKHNFKQIIEAHYPNIKINFVPINRETVGAVETVLIGLQSLDDDNNDPCLVVDCDTFYEENILGAFKSDPSNCVFYFEDETERDIFSFIEISRGLVLNIKEKIRISNNACTGAYGFDSKYNLIQRCVNILHRGRFKTNNEFYMSSVYSMMIEDGKAIKAHKVTDFTCVGTPSQLKLFCEMNSSKNKKRFCFDLDSTLVTKPTIEGDYSSVKPIQRNINYLKFLRDCGHTIIICTARRMRTHSGNVGSVVADIGKVTFDTLDRFNIPYDEIYFGKPYADFYIDDLGVDSNDFIDKATGYYDTITKPRDFNSIEIFGDHIIKRGKIDGELYYYQNIPEDLEYLKDLFPSLLEVGEDYLKLKRIHGLTASRLLLEGSFDIDYLDQILGDLGRLHVEEVQHWNVNNKTEVLDTLKNQFADRFNSLRDSSHNLNYEVINCASEFIDSYLDELKDAPNYLFGMIHGDPVFTNILIEDKTDSVKFIDMRGKIGDTYTICGPVVYDLAKIYQSLTGYDAILNSVDYTPDKELIDFFLNTCEEHYNISSDKIRKLTGCLYLSLIPLHNNENCVAFFNKAEELLK